MPHPHLGYELFKTFTIDCRSARLPEIIVDDHDVLGMPAQRDGTLPQRVLTLGALRVFQHLTRSGLTDIEIRLSFEVLGLYPLHVGLHGLASDLLPRRIPAKMRTACVRTSPGNELRGAGWANSLADGVTTLPQQARIPAVSPWRRKTASPMPRAIAWPRPSTSLRNCS